MVDDDGTTFETSYDLEGFKRKYEIENQNNTFQVYSDGKKEEIYLFGINQKIYLVSIVIMLLWLGFDGIKMAKTKDKKENKKSKDMLN